MAWAAKEPLKIETIEVAPPKAGEVRVKVGPTLFFYMLRFFFIKKKKQAQRRATVD